jgi:cytochrome c2
MAAIAAALLTAPGRAGHARAGQDEWKKYQAEFFGLSESGGATAPASELREVSVPEAEILDRCTTCHLGMADAKYSEAAQPFRSHPGEILNNHSIEKFGCTVCHGGHGAETTTEAAHGIGDSSTNALIPTKYLQSACGGCHETSYGLKGAEMLEAGRLAFEDYACYACHETRQIDDKRKFGPPLEDLKKKLKDTRWMITQLRGPQKLNPRSVMPDFKLADEEIRDIAAFLLSLETERVYPPVDLSEAVAEEGEKLFTELGCKACHAEKIDEASFRRRLPNLADAGLKLKPDWILEELNNPKELNPDARIPKLDITETDTAHIIAYLTTLKANTELIEAETLALDEASLENGKELVKKYGCYGCHKVQGLEEEKMPAAPVAEAAKKFAAANRWDSISTAIGKPRHNSTEENPLIAPEYSFDEGEVESLTTFYLDNYNLGRFDLPDGYMVPASEPTKKGLAGERIIVERNCRGCHMIEEGIKPRIEEFIALKSYVPPRIVGEGEKVQPEWAKKYLDKPEPMRPWLKMRMPKFFFTEDEIKTIIEYFSVTAPSLENARLPYTVPVDRDNIEQLQIEMGEYRLRFDKCMQCHPVSIEEGLPEDVNIEDLSINLMLSKERLRFEWIKNFLRDPDKYAGAGTKMPYVYYTPEGVPRVSDAAMWVDYVTKYLMVMDKIPEPLEEEPEEEEEDDWSNY